MLNKFILLICLLPISLWAEESPKPLNVPGGVVYIKLGDSQQDRPLVFYQQQQVLVLDQNQLWTALVGIPLSTPVGTQILTLIRHNQSETFNFEIVEKVYPAQYITIKNQRMVNPNPEDLKRITTERIPIQKALDTWSESDQIDTDFIAPVDGRLSSRFGLKKFFNNQPKNPHSGLDIAAPTGTPIIAPAPATVLNTGNYYYYGNSVFLDHGQGLISGYFHMNDIAVKAGQQLQRGDLIGKVGETGRVTGPHLHWNIYLNRSKVDPALFIDSEIARLDAANKKK